MSHPGLSESPLAEKYIGAQKNAAMSRRSPSVAGHMNSTSLQKLLAPSVGAGSSPQSESTSLRSGYHGALETASKRSVLPRSSSRTMFLVGYPAPSLYTVRAPMEF